MMMAPAFLKGDRDALRPPLHLLLLPPRRLRHRTDTLPLPDCGRTGP